MSLCNLVKECFTVRLICRLTFSVKEIFKSFVTTLSHICRGEAVGAQQSKLQQLLCQPISCFLKLDITVNNKHCPGPFSQHKAMMGNIFLRDSAYDVSFPDLFMLFMIILFTFFPSLVLQGTTSAIGECITSSNLVCCGLDNIVLRSKIQLVHLSLAVFTGISMWL